MSLSLSCVSTKALVLVSHIFDYRMKQKVAAFFFFGTFGITLALGLYQIQSYQGEDQGQSQEKVVAVLP